MNPSGTNFIKFILQERGEDLSGRHSNIFLQLIALVALCLLVIYSDL
jgi:hypothetical protein